MRRDFGTALSDLTLFSISYFCSNLVSSYISTNNNINRVKISFEPALQSLFYLESAAFIGFIRFSLIPRAQLIVVSHRLMTVLGQQLSISLLGLSYLLISPTFSSSSFCQYLFNHFNDIYQSFERTLLIIIIIAYLLNIQYIDKIIPIIFGLIPITISIITSFNYSFNCAICGCISLITLIFSYFIGPKSVQSTYRTNKLFGIRNVIWFHLIISISIYFHVVTLINLSKGNRIIINNTFIDTITLK